MLGITVRGARVRYEVVGWTVGVGYTRRARGAIRRSCMGSGPATDGWMLGVDWLITHWGVVGWKGADGFTSVSVVGVVGGMLESTGILLGLLVRSGRSTSSFGVVEQGICFFAI